MTATIAIVAAVFGVLGIIIGSLSSKLTAQNKTVLDVISEAIQNSDGKGIFLSVSLFPQDDDDDEGHDAELPLVKPGSHQGYRNN